MASQSDTTKKPQCRGCRHYYITWDQNRPHGCRAFKFKSGMLPCYEVQVASNISCLKFEPKPEKK